MKFSPRGPAHRSHSLRNALTSGPSALAVVTLALALGPACSPAATTGGTSTSSGGSSGSGSTGGSTGSSSGTGGTSSSSSSGGSSGSSSSGGSTGSGNGGREGGSAGGTTGSGNGGREGGSAGGTTGSGNGGRNGSGGSGAGSGGSTGAPDAGGGGGDVPSAPGAPGCTGVMGKFCSDFENQTAGGAPNGNGDYTVTGSGLTVDGAKAYSGTKSLHYKPTGKVGLNFTKQLPLNENYGRLMMFVTKTPPDAKHWDIVESHTSVANVWSWGGMYGKYELVVDPPDDGKDSKTAIPEGRWFCVQWKWSQGTGGKSEYHVMQDGMEVDQSPVNGHWKAGPWKDLFVGFESYGGTVPIEFWIDDLAFGEQAIACPGK